MTVEASGYPCTSVGSLRIPFYPLHEDLKNPYGENEVYIEIHLKKFTIPAEEVRKYMEKIIEIKKAKAKKEGRRFFDGPLVRLRGYGVDENHKLTLEVQPTSFFTFSATNKSLDEDIVYEMVKKRGDDYRNLNDGLANPIGTNIFIVTEDGYTIIVKRSEKLAQYPGLYGVGAAGFVEPKKDYFNPFNTAKRETQEELGVKKLKNLELIGFGRAGDDRHIELLFTAETDYTRDEVLSAPKSHKYEAQEIIPVEFTPEKLGYYLTRTVEDVPKGAVRRGNVWIPGKSPAWVPAQNKLVIDALIREYGFDKVYRAIEDAFRNYTKPIT